MKGIIEKLGLERARLLTETICKKRVRHMKKSLKAGDYGREGSKLYGYAVYYIQWYGWLAENGGTRGAAKIKPKKRRAAA